MTFEDYMKNGGDRYEKLVIIYKTHPEALSRGFNALLQAIEEGVDYSQFDELQYAYSKWEDGTLKKDLEKQGADFV